MTYLNHTWTYDETTWARSERISNDPVSGPNGIWSDSAVYRPLLAQQITTSGSHTWTTNSSYHTGQGNINDYGHAYYVEELGETIYQCVGCYREPRA